MKLIKFQKDINEKASLILYCNRRVVQPEKVRDSHGDVQDKVVVALIGDSSYFARSFTGRLFGSSLIWRCCLSGGGFERFVDRPKRYS